MKLDITVLRYLSREDWRVLMSVELGMKVQRGERECVARFC